MEEKLRKERKRTVERKNKGKKKSRWREREGKSLLGFVCVHMTPSFSQVWPH